MKIAPAPNLFRLTLSKAAFDLLKPNLRYLSIGMVVRGDGKIDVAVSPSLMDQLKTAALPKENLSDTVIRIKQPKQSVK